ncbi:MAG: efflux RND transporter periplasmic adaptor subunit [Mesorhizobium sp.]
MKYVRAHSAAVVLFCAFGLTMFAASAEDFRVVPKAVTEWKAVYGEIQTVNIVPARARISGTVVEVRVTEGQEIRKGAVVASIEDEKLALQLRAAEARVAAFNSQMTNARTELERAQDLLRSGAAAQARVDAAKVQLDVLTNQLAAAIAEKAVIEQNAREGDVLSPADGRVLTVPITAGSVIMAGEAVARVASGRYYLRLSLPERHAAEISEGATVVIGGRNGEQPSRQGHIAKVYPEIQNGRVIADVDVSDIGNYFINERTLVSIPVGHRTILAVPTSAIRTVHGIDYVTLKSPRGARDVAVVPGERMEVDGRQMIEVLTGLSAEDEIVLQ